jgi:hypothetical protein
MTGLKWLRIGITGGLCEEGNELLDSIPFGEFID